MTTSAAGRAADEQLLHRHDRRGRRLPPRADRQPGARTTWPAGSPARPPQDTYGAAVYGSGPSSYWRLAEASGTTANDASLNNYAGTYLSGTALGRGSLIGLGSDKAAGFDGTNDTVTAKRTTTGPHVYSGEAWFQSTSTSGGQLFGLGTSNTTTLSTKVDRTVYVANDGTLRFGVIRADGTKVTLATTDGYTDGQPHHVAAVQSASGMRLYVDGQLEASNSEPTNTSYAGYWRIGGDNLTGWPSKPTSNFLNATIDEAAFYGRALTASEVTDHVTKGQGTAPNIEPTAEFDSTADALEVEFDSSDSEDPDGNITGYLWDFGAPGTTDTSTQANPTYTYDEPGTYTVTLRVTDNDGDTDEVQHDVTVSIPRRWRTSPPPAAG